MQSTIESIYYYPIKSGNGVTLSEAYLTFAGIEGDRKWALVSPNHTSLPNGEWMPCSTFERYKIRPEMASWQTKATENGIKLTINGHDINLVEGERAIIGGRQVQLAKADKGYWDDKDASISIININTVKAISKATGIELDPIRFRGNIYISAEPWSEFQWLGKQLNIGEANLNLFMPIERCRAISVNPNTGTIEQNIPALLALHFGHTYCGIYATVIKEGNIEVGATLDIQDAIDVNAIKDKASKPNMSPIQVWPRNVKVVDIIEDADGIRSIWLRDELANSGAWDTYKAGQHIRLHDLKTSNECPSTWRNYTVSKYKNGLFRITVKRGEGEGSRRIHTLKVNDNVIMTGPDGELTLPRQAKSIYFITAGIGITPAVAMLSDLAEFKGAIYFIHTSKLKQLALWHEIEDFAESKPNVSCTLFISDADDLNVNHTDLNTEVSPVTSVKTGRPNMSQLAHSVYDNDAHVITCGPASFSSKILKAFANANIPAERIGSETFISSSIDVEFKEPSTVGPHEVRFTKSGKKMIWHKSEGTLLDLAERNGLMPKSHCRAGICGACKVDLDSGAVEKLVGEALADDSVLLCCSVPKSDVEIGL